MASRSCVSGYGCFLASSDGHDSCPSCLGYQYAEFRRATSAHGQGDLRITVRASPSSTSPRASHSSSASHHLVFPDELTGSSDRAGPSILFGAPADDRMSIAASGDELGSEDDDSAALPPSGRVALPESDPELTAMLSRAESVGLHWRPPPSPKYSLLDYWFLGAQADCRQPPLTSSHNAFRHILPRREVSTLPPAAAPPSAHRRGRPTAVSTSVPTQPQQQPSQRPQRGAGRRKAAQPASAPAKPVKRQGRQRP